MKKLKAQEPEIPVLLMQEGTPFVPDTSRSAQFLGGIGLLRFLQEADKPHARAVPQDVRPILMATGVVYTCAAGSGWPI